MSRSEITKAGLASAMFKRKSTQNFERCGFKKNAEFAELCLICSGVGAKRYASGVVDVSANSPAKSKPRGHV